MSGKVKIGMACGLSIIDICCIDVKHQANYLTRDIRLTDPGNSSIENNIDAQNQRYISGQVSTETILIMFNRKSCL
jgi:hypothetical protein